MKSATRWILLLPFLFSQVLHPAQAAPQQVTLPEAFQAALKRSETLTSEELLVDVVDAQYAQAKGNVLPNITASAYYLVQELPSDPLSQSFFPKNQPEAKVTLTQPLFRGLREFATLRQLKHLTRAQEYARDRAWLALYNEVAQSYYGVLAREQDLKNLKDQNGLYQGRIREIGERVRAGTSSETDRLTSQAAQASIDSQIEVAVGQLNGAREAFAFLTGYSSQVDLAPAELQMPRPATVDEYLRTVERRPDIQDAMERSKAADEAITVAKGAHLPSADLLASYYFKRPPGILEGSKWDVQFSVSLPIYAGGSINAEVRQATIQLERSELDVMRIRRQAGREVRTLYVNYQSQLESIRALEASLEIAEKNYQLLKRDYRRGLTRNLDVLQALTASQEARRSLVAARFAAKTTWILLRTAAGLLQPRGAEDQS